MKELQQKLQQGIIEHVYLLCGEEAYLRRMCEERIRKACIRDDDTMNYHLFEDKNIPVAEIIDLAQTMPFFADKRLIVMRNTGFFKGACDELVDYIPQVSPTTCMLFVEEEADKRTRLYKAVKKHGRVVECKRQDEKALTVWIASRLKKEDRQITQQDLRFFLEKTGMDMDIISQELEKLVCYTLGRNVITAQDIEEVCTSQITNHIFDMINAMAEKQLQKALNLYYDLLALKEAPLKILALINRQFNLLMQVKDLQRLGRTRGEIASQLGLPPFVVGKYISQSAGFTLAQLYQALGDSVQAEEDVKMGRIADKLSVELLIVKYSRS